MANENTNNSSGPAGSQPAAAAPPATAEKKEAGHWIHPPKQTPVHLDPDKIGYWEGTVRGQDGHQKTIRAASHSEITEKGQALISGRKGA